MVDWEEKVRRSIVRTNSDVSRGNGVSTCIHNRTSPLGSQEM